MAIYSSCEEIPLWASATTDATESHPSHDRNPRGRRRLILCPVCGTNLQCFGFTVNAGLSGTMKIRIESASSLGLLTACR
jgi:hypothetical protein